MKNLVIKIGETLDTADTYCILDEERHLYIRYYFYAVNKEEDDESKAVLTSSSYVSIAECAAAAVELLPLSVFASPDPNGYSVSYIQWRNRIIDVSENTKNIDRKRVEEKGQEYIDHIKRSLISDNEERKDDIEYAVLCILGNIARAKLLGIDLN